MAGLPAEAALLVPVLSADMLNRGDGRANRPAGSGYHRVRATDAPVADVHARPRDQLLDLLLVLPAERARQISSRTRHSPTVDLSRRMPRPRPTRPTRPRAPGSRQGTPAPAVPPATRHQPGSRAASRPD